MFELHLPCPCFSYSYCFCWCFYRIEIKKWQRFKSTRRIRWEIFLFTYYHWNTYPFCKPLSLSVYLNIPSSGIFMWLGNSVNINGFLVYLWDIFSEKRYLPNEKSRNRYQTGVKERVRGNLTWEKGLLWWRYNIGRWPPDVPRHKPKRKIVLIVFKILQLVVY